MKRFLSLICVLACLATLCLASFSIAAFAAEDATVTVHAQVPADWTDPGCWAWDGASQKNAFDNWPGQSMTKDGEWYTIEVPAWVDNIIINAGGGSIQTVDMPVEAGKELWVVVSSEAGADGKYTGEITYAAPEGAEPPATEETEATTEATTAPTEEATEATTEATEATEESAEETTKATMSEAEKESIAKEEEAERSANRTKALITILIVVAVVFVVAVVISLIPKRY